MVTYTQIDYLVVGHISRDLSTEGFVPGGTVLYSALTAQALGCRVAVLTSAAEDYDLAEIMPGIAIHVVPAEESTTFQNHYSAGRRSQTIYSVASTLTTQDVPMDWQRAAIVHLGPIANEIEPNMIRLFSNSIIGLTPQGWYRSWDESGQVRPGDWKDSADVIPFSAAIILSPEDVPGPETVSEIREVAPIVVLTQQVGGCIVYFHDEKRVIPAPIVSEVNPTGAGDIFAAAFLFRLHQTKGNPWEAAEFANRVAATSVAQLTLNEKLNSIREVLGRED
jgi:sugar/nucleoside kinase (ribokinase family)